MTKSKTSFGAGTYIVGPDSAPGTYRAPRGRRCYLASLSGFVGSTDEMLAEYSVRSVETQW